MISYCAVCKVKTNTNVIRVKKYLTIDFNNFYFVPFKNHHFISITTCLTAHTGKRSITL